MEFPRFPAENQVHLASNGISYKWDGEKWTALLPQVLGPTGPSGATGAQGATGPTGPSGSGGSSVSFATSLDVQEGTDNTKVISPATLRNDSLFLDIPFTTFATSDLVGVTFTPIPSWAKRVTLMLWNVSSNVATQLRIRVGTAAGLATSGYTGATYTMSKTGSTIVHSTTTHAVGFEAGPGWAMSGSLIFNKTGVDNIWLASGTLTANDSLTVFTATISGRVHLLGSLTQLFITTTNGSYTFSSGAANMLME
jgi:hypothetical protein